ncbi:Sjogren's syndrome/scleroderma autoantigen 1 family protein [Haloferax larsenii]|uniref:Uncharacterized Zn-finger containing protein, UPF0148 family n=1 Tax=Haloferax larsenii TaxID=302484 RepID=A0A1H7LV87_HALLR|nr:Sjogren's syndrome/scleroderma autoantigen 1 family protein [Haloferax larsenii]SEL02237.1 Uncharacterized Zn-finger containing protein, UPF0148 family [Haloferax larsenii]
MSDFDKEAERQRLREKYEQDEAKRRSTQRMSELLLKGATMTNKHCDQCGDPIFRYDGEEFCPTCQAGGQSAAADEGAADAAGEAGAESDARTVSEADTETVGEADAGRVAENDAGRVAEANAETVAGSGTVDREPPATTENVGQSAASAAASEQADEQLSERTAESKNGARQTRQRASTTTRAVDGDIASARKSLVRTLTWAATEAEATDDPRRAVEYLSAAREAAAAIDALDR